MAIQTITGKDSTRWETDLTIKSLISSRIDTNAFSLASTTGTNALSILTPSDYGTGYKILNTKDPNLSDLNFSNAGQIQFNNIKTFEVNGNNKYSYSALIQADSTNGQVQIGDVSQVNNGTRFNVSDTNQEMDFYAGNIYFNGTMGSYAGAELFDCNSINGTIGFGDLTNFVNGTYIQIDDPGTIINLQSSQLNVNGSAGLNTTVTSASLVGKTLTFTNGILTGFA